MKKIIDSKGKLFGKVSVVDIMVVAVLIVLVVFATSKFDQTQQTRNSDKTIEYTAKVYFVRQPTVDAINENLNGIVEYDTKKAIGDIVDVKVEKAKEITELSDGTYKLVEHEDKYDVELTLKAKGTETVDNYYTEDGKALIVGDVLSMYNENVMFSATVQSVSVVEEEW